MNQYIIGGLFGAILGLLYAPATGRSSRAKLKDKATKFRNDVNHFVSKEKKHLGNKLLGLEHGLFKYVAKFSEKSEECSSQVEEGSPQPKEKFAGCAENSNNGKACEIASEPEVQAKANADQPSDNFGQESGNAEQSSDSDKQASDSDEQSSDSDEQASDSDEPSSDSDEQASDSDEQSSESDVQSSDSAEQSNKAEQINKAREQLANKAIEVAEKSGPTSDEGSHLE